MKSANKKKMGVALTFFFGVSFAYLVWLFWSKLTEYIGDSTKAIIIIGIIVVIGMVMGYLNLDKMMRRFT